MSKNRVPNPFVEKSSLEDLLGVPSGKIREKIHRDARSAGGKLLTSKDLFGEIIDELSEAPVAEPGEAPENPTAAELLDAIQLSPLAERELADRAPVPRGVETDPALGEGPGTARAQEESSSRPPGSGGLLDLAYSTLLSDPKLRADVGPLQSAPGPARDAVPTSVYGQYILVERIASGGMAEVFRAKRQGVEGFEKTVAIKRILPHLSTHKDFVEMFIYEAKLAAGLSHPNVVNIFELGKIEDTYFIAMEYVDGRDLRSVLAQARDKHLGLSIDLSALIVSKVAAALGHAHRQKDAEGRDLELVHRDISPQNVLISYDGEVKLVDFGIAKAAVKAPHTDSGSLRGKLLYMSPEQAWGRTIDHRSDIFSLGVVSYELLTGQSPFSGSSDMGILEQVRTAAVPPPSKLNPMLPGQLENLVMKALRKSPEARYQDADEMLQDLESYLRSRPPVGAAELSKVMKALFDLPEVAPADALGDTDPDLDLPSR